MIINKYTDKQKISFLQAIKYFKHCEGTDHIDSKGNISQIIKLSMFDTLIMTDGILTDTKKISPDKDNKELQKYDEVHMSELTFEKATYVLQILIANRCTNTSNDKPFQYNSENICNLYMKNPNNKEILKNVKNELEKLTKNKVNSKLNYDYENAPSSNHGIYNKVFKKSKK